VHSLTDNTEPFDALLEWLDPDRETAGQRYEVIRAGLIRMFISNGLSDAEHYADETIDRVMKRLPEIKETYVGDPVKYFHGVARNVIREARRRKEVLIDIVPDRFLQEPYKSDTSECLSNCLELLPRDKQEFILDYHLYQGHAKIEHHRQMAGELAITEGALRTRAHHLRVTLEKCVLECIDNFGRNKTHVSSHR
jgi:DNA-directed RNA polymerase specialized sigma24 family protein